MNSSRLFAVGPLAGLVTSGLFLIMQLLVGGEGDINLDQPQPRRFIDFVQEPVPPEPPRRIWDIEPPEVVAPPEIIGPEREVLPGPSGDGPPVPPPPRPTGPDLVRPDSGQSDGDYMPLVIVQAQYPVRAQERAIEGYVTVELTVAPDGSVPRSSIIVIDAEPKGYFEREAIKAAAKFKYKPKVVNGSAQMVTGVRYRFSFNLQD